MTQAPTVRRLFGFEFELGIPVTSEDPTTGQLRPPRSNAMPLPRDPTRTVSSPTIGKANDGSFWANIDHSTRLNKLVPVSAHEDGKAPIIELVTAPMDEFALTKPEVEAEMRKLQKVAARIQIKVVAPKDRITLDTLPDFTANPGGVNFIGISRTVVPNLILHDAETVDAYVQQTYGLSLKRVGSEFAAQETSGLGRRTRMHLPQPGATRKTWRNG